MRRSSPVLFAILLALSLSPADAQRNPDVAIVNVTVIDAERGAIPDQTIVVSGTRIRDVGPTSRVRIPAGTVRIDGAGKFAIPGLWDMHFHMTGWTLTAPELLVAYGVTGVRDMGGDWPSLKSLRDSIRGGFLVGPQMMLAGLFVDGDKPGVPFRYPVHSREDGAAAVDSLVRLGVDFIKVHNAVPRDAYFGVLDAARKRGIAVAGHVPMTITPSEASDSGQRSIEHVATIFEGTFTAAHPNQLEQLAAGMAFIANGADTLGDRYARNHTWFDPTLYVYKLRIHRGQIPADVDSLMRFVSKETRKNWESFGGPSPRDTLPFVIQVRQQFYDGTARMTGVFSRQGVRILAGTDVAGPGVMPGYSLHRELQALVNDAGLSPLAAIKAATLEPARYFGADSLGAIAPGKVADVVLLAGDPLQSIANTTRIAGVCLRGRWLDRAALDALLARAAAIASKR